MGPGHGPRGRCEQELSTLLGALDAAPISGLQSTGKTHKQAERRGGTKAVVLEALPCEVRLQGRAGSAGRRGSCGDTQKQPWHRQEEMRPGSAQGRVMGRWEAGHRLRHEGLRLETRRSLSPPGQPSCGARAQAGWASVAWGFRVLAG